MGYTDKLQKLCALRGLDQTDLAVKLHLSKSSISRILSGVQEPKLRVAYDLAQVLGVTLDYLVEDSPDIGPTDQLVMVTQDELAILKMVRLLGTTASMVRLMNAPITTLDAPPASIEGGDRG
jgi:transcriptional regulator with XRE-family HTH domain